MHPADAVVDDPDAVGQRQQREAPGRLGPEPVVAQEDVADPGHEHARGHGRDLAAHARGRVGLSVERLELVRAEVGVAAVPLVQLGGRVVLDHHRDMRVPVDVEVDRGDDRGQPVDEEVLRVGAPGGVQSHARALADGHVADPHGVLLGGHRRVDPRVPPRGRAERRDATKIVAPMPSYGTARRRSVEPADRSRVEPRSAPCSRSKISGGMRSERSMIAPARGPYRARPASRRRSAS